VDTLPGRLSADGCAIYTLRIGETIHCACVGFSYRGWCYHVEAASQRYAAFWAAPSRVEGREPRGSRVTDVDTGVG
jgi:hypothetical protein